MLKENSVLNIFFRSMGTEKVHQRSRGVQISKSVALLADNLLNLSNPMIPVGGPVCISQRGC